MAQLDPSIFLQTRPKSAFDYLQEFAAADQQRQQSQLQKLQMLGQQRAFDDAEQARSIRNRGLAAVQGLGGSATDEQRISALRGVGDYGTADAIEKAMLERQKTGATIKKDQAETDAKMFETGRKQIDLILQAVSSAKDQPSYERAVQFLAAQGVDVSQVPAQYDPNAVAQYGQIALTAKERIDNYFKQVQQEEAARHNKATEGLTARGQNLTDARARDGLAQAESQFNRKLAAEGEKPLNDVQSKALLFGSRMQEADKIIGKLVASGTKTPSLLKQAAESVPGVGGALGMLANATVASPEQQQLEQAQRDFINATLRRESGAVISDAEFDNARKQYFPQPGDTPTVMAQKAKNRSLATQGILAEVPEKKRSSLSKPQAGGASGSWDGWSIEKVD